MNESVSSDELIAISGASRTMVKSRHRCSVLPVIENGSMVKVRKFVIQS